MNDLEKKKVMWSAFRECDSGREDLFCHDFGFTLSEFDAFEKGWNTYLDKLNKELPLEERRKILVSIFAYQVKIIQEKIQGFSDLYMTSKALDRPFTERKYLTDMVKTFHLMKVDFQKKLQELKRYSHDLSWVSPTQDYPKIKDMGFREFFKKYYYLAL